MEGLVGSNSRPAFPEKGSWSKPETRGHSGWEGARTMQFWLWGGGMKRSSHRGGCG